MNCPQCSKPLHGLATRCWAGGEGCGWTAGKSGNVRNQRGFAATLPMRPTAPDTEPRRITIPWDELVSVNKRKGGMVGKLSKEYRSKLAAMRETVEHAATEARWSTLTGPVRLDVEFYPPDRRRRDVSNLLKALEDSMTGPIYEDDAQIVEMHVFKMPVSSNPRAVVTVTAIEREQAA